MFSFLVNSTNQIKWFWFFSFSLAVSYNLTGHPVDFFILAAKSGVCHLAYVSSYQSGLFRVNLCPSPRSSVWKHLLDICWFVSTYFRFKVMYENPSKYSVNIYFRLLYTHSNQIFVVERDTPFFVYLELVYHFWTRYCKYFAHLFWTHSWIIILMMTLFRFTFDGCSPCYHTTLILQISDPNKVINWISQTWFHGYHFVYPVYKLLIVQ